MKTGLSKMIVAYVADLIVNGEVINVKGIISFNGHMPVLPLAQIADWVARENATILNKQISSIRFHNIMEI